MNPEILYTIVRRLLMPKHRWIKDFIWHKNYSTDSQSNYWTLELIPKSDLSGSDEDINDLRKEVEKEMESLFRMISPPKNEKFFMVMIS